MYHYKDPNADRPFKTKLSNGLSILFYPRENMMSTAMGVFVRNGAQNEVCRQDFGISHVIEHMLFKSTTKRSNEKLMSELSRLGATVNASTHYDTTDFYLTTPHTSALRVMELLGEMICRPAFLEKDWGKERGAILEEYKMRFDQHPLMGFEDAMHHVFKNNKFRLAVPIIGTEETLKAMTTDDIRTYWQEHYTAGNITVVVVGKFEEDKMMETIIKAFRDTGLTGHHRTTLGWMKMPDKVLGGSFLRRKTKQCHICNITWAPFEDGTREGMAFEFMSSMIGGGMTSRLWTEIREKRGLAYETGTSVSLLLNRGMLLETYVGCDPKNRVKCAKLIHKIREDLMDHVVSKTFFNQERDHMIGAIMTTHDKPALFTLWVGQTYARCGKVLTSERQIEDLLDLKPVDIQKVAYETFCQQPNWSTCVIPQED